MDLEGVWESTFMELEGDTLKRIDNSNGSNKTAAVVTAVARTGLESDGSDESNGGGANVAWLGGSVKTAIR